MPKMTQAEVVALMEGSNSEDEWHANIDKVRQAFGGQYPNFWYADIIQPGVASKTAAKFGKTADITVTAISRKPIPNLYGRPTSMPYLQKGEKIIGIYDQGLGEKEMPCSSLAEMQELYDSYASGMALKLRWEIASTSESTIPT